MALPVYLHRVVRRQRRRILKPIPADQGVGIVSSDHDIVADVKVFRIGAVGHDRDADVFDAAILHGKAAWAHDALESCIERNFSIADGESFKEVVVGCHHVKEAIGAVSVEDHFTIAGGLDRNGFVRCALLRQHIGSVKVQSQGIDVVQPVALVEAGMYQDYVPRHDARFGHHPPVARVAASIVRLVQAGKSGWFLRSLVIQRVNM